MAELGKLDVLVRAIGAKETEEDLGNITKQEKKTGKELANHGKAMAKFATKFAGVMGIVSASLTGLTSALLLKTPIISEIGFALGVLVEELAFMIDTVLAPALEPLVEGLFWLADEFHKLPAPMQKFITIAVLVTGAIALITTAVLAVVIAIISVIGSLVAMGTAGLVIVGVFVLLGHALAVLIVNLLFFAPLIAGIIVAAVLLKDKFIEVVGLIKEKFSAFVTWLDEHFGEEFRELTTEIGTTVSTWKRWIGNALDWIMTKVSTVLGALKNLWDEDFLYIKTVTEAIWGGITLVIGTAWDIIEGALDIGINTLTNLFTAFFALLRGDWDKVWEELGEIGSDFWDLGGTIWTTISGGITAVSTLIGQVLSTIKRKWDDIWEELKIKVENILGNIKDLMDNIGFTGIAVTLAKTINSIIGSLNKISVKVPDWVPGYGGKTFGFDIAKIPIPEMEIGGKVESAGIAKVHPGETVLTRQLTEMLEQFFASGGAGGGSGDVYLDSQKVGSILNKNNMFQASTSGWG